MPLFYFHEKFDGVVYEDPDGSDMPSLEAAREEAFADARELWCAAIRRNEDLSDNRFVIADEQGRTKQEVPFTDALPDGLRKRLGNG